MRALIVLASLLAGCATMPETTVVQSPVAIPTPAAPVLPEKALREHPVYQRASGQVREYWTQAERNTVELEACNRDKAALRALPQE